MREQVIEFEKILKNSEKKLQALNQALDDFEDNQANYQALKAYYLSEEYQKDVELSDDTDIYDDIPCGVLSQDAIYNLISDSFYTAIRMLELATTFIKEH